MFHSNRPMACRQQLPGKKIRETFDLEQKCRATKIHQFCPSNCLKVKGHVCTMVPSSMEQTLRQFVGLSYPKEHQRSPSRRFSLLQKLDLNYANCLSQEVHALITAPNACHRMLYSIKSTKKMPWWNQTISTLSCGPLLGALHWLWLDKTRYVMLWFKK